MKQLILLFVGLCLAIVIEAQVVKTVDVTAGNLNTLLTPTEISTITSLTLKGTINAWDVQTIQNQMPLLSELDLGQTTITATIIPGTANFPANWFPGPSKWKNSLNYGGLNKPLLTRIELPFTLEVIGSGAFSGCSGLTSITIPPTVTTIGWSAFDGCKGLTSITIPPSVTDVNEWAFSNCGGLTEFSISGSMTSIVKGMFAGCSGLTSVTIPSSVTSIGQSAFTNCTGLTSILLPTTVENIGAFAFWECKNLTSIYSYRNVPAQISNIFDQIIKSTCILYVPFGSRTLYAAADEWKDFINIVELPDVILSSTNINIAGSPSSIATVELNSNVTWSAICDQSWLKLNTTSGNGNYTLGFIADANPNFVNRTASVTISAPGVGSKTIVITQQTLTVGLIETEQNIAQLKCYPNPFAGEITINIQNPKQARIKVDIYNMSGQLIKNLLISSTNEQENLRWNGTNEAGQKVSSGMYICKMNNKSKQLIFEGSKRSK